MVVRAHTYAPAAGVNAGAEYISAAEALECLRHAAANHGATCACTTFDDPGDWIVGVWPAFTASFREEEDGILTFAWALELEDRERYSVRIILVDGATGDVFDDHDGRLDGGRG